MILLLLLLGQADVAPASSKPESTSWSILAPVGNEPCRPADVKPVPGEDDDIIVCAQPIPSQKLPYPNEVVLNRPKPSNPDMTGIGALAAESEPCATRMAGCTVGFGPPIVPMIVGAVDAAKSLFAKKPDKTGRVPIRLDDPPPTGKLLP